MPGKVSVVSRVADQSVLAVVTLRRKQLVQATYYPELAPQVSLVMLAATRVENYYDYINLWSILIVWRTILQGAHPDQNPYVVGTSVDGLMFCGDGFDSPSSRISVNILSALFIWQYIYLRRSWLVSDLSSAVHL